MPLGVEVTRAVEGVDLTVDEARLVADLQQLAQFGRNEQGGIDRASFSPADLAARTWLLGRCDEAGLHAETDGIGNIVISSPSLEEGITDQDAVWTGSHIDAVPNGGAFDGPVGALAAIESLRRLHEEGVRLARPVRAVVYADEEGNYAHLLGSSAIARGFTVEELSRLAGRDGDRFADAFTAAGGGLEAAARTHRERSSLHATVELHIEQGPVLEDRGVDIGIVTGIVDIGGGTVRFTGRADHAGTTPMGRRKDAAVAAAEFICRLPELAPLVSTTAVVTSGIVRLVPGGSNVIPGAAEVVVDLRDRSYERTAQLERLIVDAAEEVAARHGMELAFDFEQIVPGAVMDDGIRAVIGEVAAGLGYSTMDIQSGAGHDSQNMATLAPTGMIFVPSTGGRSHSPAEHTPWPDVVRGANTLLRTVAHLASAAVVPGVGSDVRTAT